MACQATSTKTVDCAVEHLTNHFYSQKRIGMLGSRPREMMKKKKKNIILNTTNMTKVSMLTAALKPQSVRELLISYIHRPKYRAHGILSVPINGF